MTSWLQVVWHKQEESLINLHCGREYHVYVVLFNAFGASPASQVTDSLNFMLLIKAHSHDVRLTYAFDVCVCGRQLRCAKNRKIPIFLPQQSAPATCIKHSSFE